jgi:aspartate aminotransferase
MMTTTVTSARAHCIQPSVTLELAARAKALMAAGEPVINLSAGEPDMPTPAPIVEAAHRALDAGGHFTYTATPGVLPLRKALAQTYTERLGLPLTPQHFVVSNGAKQALYNALATATDPGQRIGVLRPYWVTYVEQARALGTEPVVIDCPASTGFRPDLHALHTELRRGLRVLIVNSPGNPTGAVYGRDDWSALLELVAETDTLLVSDEIYEDIVFAPLAHVSPLHVRPDLAERTCVVSGFSKAFAMTGWRVGFSIAPPAWSAAMDALQGHVTSNINAIAQQAALAALGRRDVIAPMLDVFRGRRDLVMQRMARIPFLRAREPEGTFYLYADVTDLLGSFAPDVDAIAARLLEEYKVVLVPGSAFGDDRHVRLSFAASEADLNAAFDRLETAFA